MEKHELATRVLAFVHPGGRSSCGMIRTTEGVVLIDTTARPVDIQSCLDLAQVTVDDICLALLTHSHSDHTSGIPLLNCPVLAHKLTYQRIRKRGTERAKTQVPTEVFENQRELDIGGRRLEIIHVGGHTPGSSIVWMAEERILFAGDIIFQGRYPFLVTADVEKLMEVLRWIPSLGARIIVPGHGILCDNEEVQKQLAYIEETWERTLKHIKEGHSLKEAQTDPKYPRYSEVWYETLHPRNIKAVYQQLKRKDLNRAKRK